MSHSSNITSVTAGAILGAALMAATVAMAQTPAPDTKGTASDPTVGLPSAPASLSGPAGAVKDSPVQKDTTIPGTRPGNHTGSERDGGSKGK